MDSKHNDHIESSILDLAASGTRLASSVKNWNNLCRGVSFHRYRFDVARKAINRLHREGSLLEVRTPQAAEDACKHLKAVRRRANEMIIQCEVDEILLEDNIRQWESEFEELIGSAPDADEVRKRLTGGLKSIEEFTNLKQQRLEQ